MASTKSPPGFLLDFDPSGFAAMGAFFSALPESNPERQAFMKVVTMVAFPIIFGDIWGLPDTEVDVSSDRCILYNIIYPCIYIYIWIFDDD